MIDIATEASLLREEALVTLSWVQLARAAYEQAGVTPSDHVRDLMARAETAAHWCVDRARALDECLNPQPLDSGRDLVSHPATRLPS